MKIDAKLVTVGALVILAILLIGQFCINLNVKNEYSVELTSDGISYNIDLGYESYYSVVSFDDGGLGRNQTYIACFDDEHVWFKSNDYIQNTLEHLTRGMWERGLELTTQDTDSIVEIMESEIAKGSSDTTVVFMTGSLPSEIWDGENECLLLRWLEIGGDIVWGSGPIGYNVSTSSGFEPIENDPGLVLFGIEGAANNGDFRVYDNERHPEGLADMFRVYFSETTWGVMVGISDDQLVTEHQAEGYAAVSTTRYCDGTGSITVFGGDVDNNLASYVAQYIASGLGYRSEIVDHQMGIGKHATGTLDASPTNPVVFVTIGLMSDNIVLYDDFASSEMPIGVQNLSASESPPIAFALASGSRTQSVDLIHGLGETAPEPLGTLDRSF